MKERLGAQSESERSRASQNICAHLEALSLSAARAAVFLATGREPNVNEYSLFLQNNGVDIYAPSSLEGEPVFASINFNWSNLQTNSRGWREPRESSGGKLYAASEMDLIILPGLAFDSEGARLGQGGGWYDRALENLPAGVLCIGVCFDFQIVAAIPREPHDQNVSMIVTDKRILHV